jgi:hypothetical protein
MRCNFFSGRWRKVRKPKRQGMMSTISFSNGVLDMLTQQESVFNVIAKDVLLFQLTSTGDRFLL